MLGQRLDGGRHPTDELDLGLVVGVERCRQLVDVDDGRRPWCVALAAWGRA
jgi:hypothetical protein